MTAPGNTLKTIADQVSNLCHKRATGELIVSNSAYQGHIHLLSGRLLYATAGVHPARRWERAIKQICPQWIPDPSELSGPHLWEYQLLYHGIKNKQLTMLQAKTIIKMVAQEVFFDLGCYPDFQMNWKENEQGATELALSLSLSYLEVEPDLSKVVQMQEQWQAAGLGNLSPTLAPVIKADVGPDALGGLGKYMKGQLTLWDISAKLGKSVINVTKALIPLLKKRIVQFKKIPDLPTPVVDQGSSSKGTAAVVATNGHQKKGLIACIDDSPVILQTLKKILEGAGYQTLGISEPMRGVAKLIEHQPDVIILDLVMPNASGYSVCKFLRQTSVFEKTPIIVLTSRDTLIDRNRAKLVGASDFLGKPPDPQKTVEMVEKYLRDVEERETAEALDPDISSPTF